MSSASWALQTAIFAALSANTGLKTLLGTPPRIYDEVPRSAAMPYLVIGEDKQADWSTATDTGTEHALTLNVWSRARGRKECKTITDTIIAALDNAALSLPAHVLISLNFRNADVQRLSDGQTTRATLRFRAITEPQ